MKRAGKILCLSLMIVLMATTVSFASGLALVSSYPEEGDATFTPQNVAIKLEFSEKIADPASIAANVNRFSIVDAEGNAIEFDPLYNETKYPNEVWLQVTETLIQNSAYKVTIAEGMQSSTGSTLDEAIVLNFSTRNTEADSQGYMVLMLVMIAGMIVFTIFDTRRKLKKEGAEKGEEAKVNPYKEAKRTGKPVEEIIAQIEKEKAQAAKKRARAAGKNGGSDDTSEPGRPGYKKVKTLRAISEKGYATPKSFIEERIAREEAAIRAKEKAAQRQQAKSKGSKQQQKKKK